MKGMHRRMLFETFCTIYFNVNSVNLKENERNLEIPRTSYWHQLSDDRYTPFKTVTLKHRESYTICIYEMVSFLCFPGIAIINLLRLCPKPPSQERTCRATGRVMLFHPPFPTFWYTCAKFFITTPYSQPLPHTYF